MKCVLTALELALDIGCVINFIMRHRKFLRDNEFITALHRPEIRNAYVNFNKFDYKLLQEL